MNILDSKEAYWEECRKAVAELGVPMPPKPKMEGRGEFPADLSEVPADELGFLLGHYSLIEAYSLAKCGITQSIMIIFKERQLEEHDEEILGMTEVVLQMQAAGREAARKEGRRFIYKHAEAEYKKFEKMAASYKCLKEAISREITRRDIRDRLGSYRGFGDGQSP